MNIEFGGAATVPASPVRRAVELALRGVALISLALLVALQWPRRDVSTREAAPVQRMALPGSGGDSGGLAAARALLPFVSSEPPQRVHIGADRIPGLSARGAIAAALHAGTLITWDGEAGALDARGLAIVATAAADPQGGVTVQASGTFTAPLLLRDDAGALDSLGAVGGASSDGTAPARVAVIRARRIATAARATQRGSHAHVAAPAAVAPRRVLLFARPGWEAKFTVAALEEAGWKVDGTLRIAPRASVTIGAPGTLDTARYSAAVVIDSGVAPHATLTRFARDGGGVVIAGAALHDRALASMLPARVSGLRPAIPGGLATSTPTSGLVATRLAADADAVVLARDAGATRSPAVVVRRHGSGRVTAVAWHESWRWRMEGGTDATDGADAHRRWWGALVGAVAYMPPQGEPDDITSLPGDAAPYADFVARIGAPAVAPTAIRSVASEGRTTTLLLMLAFAALLLEWASRRARGAR